MFYGHSEDTEFVPASPAALFAYLDHHDRLSGAMGKAWLMRVGNRLTIDRDELAGTSAGAKLRVTGRLLGIPLSVEEVVTVHDPPFRKAWATAGEVRLRVIGSYRMGFSIAPDGPASQLRVFIDYSLPAQRAWRWLGRMLAGACARWWTRCMVLDATRAFQAPPLGERHGLRLSGTADRRGAYATRRTI